MIDFDAIPCIRDHKHLWNAHRVCQWCNNEKYHIELLALRKKIEELKKIEVNDIVQISLEINHHDGFWAGNLLIVTKVESWGVQGYCRTEGGNAYIRLKTGQFEKVGSLNQNVEKEIV